ncbi:copia protein [Tanacetum coccineum]
MSSSSSAFGPTECKCGLSLMTPTSWTRDNPARRFGVCPNKYLENKWYKTQLYEMHLLLNPSQREELENELTSREELAVLQVEFADMEGQMQQLMKELKKSQKNAFFWKSTAIVFGVMASFIAKVTAIEESKDLTSLSLDELIGNLKVHEMIIKKDSEIVKAKVERKSIALKAKKESSDEECSTSGSEDKEYVVVVRDFKKFIKRRGSWSDSGRRYDEKIQDETCLVAQAPNEVCSESSYFSDENSSIDDLALDNEYDKLCKMSLKIITKNKRLKAIRNSLENELRELKDKLSILEKNKGVDLDCAKCHTLKIENEKLKEESTRLNKFEKSTHCLNEMLSNQKPSGDKLGLGFNSFEASSSGTKEIKFVKAQKKTCSDGGPIIMGGPLNVQAAPKINMGPPPATPGSEKTVSFQKSILGPRPKHIIVNKVKIPVASDNEVKQFYKPLTKPGVGFSKTNFRSKTPPPRRVNNNYSRPKTPQPKRHVGRQNQPHGFPICLGVDLEPDEWIKDSGCSKHMTGNRKLFSTYKAYNGGNVIFGSNLRGQICDNKCRVTFSELDSEITKDGKIIGGGTSTKKIEVPLNNNIGKQIGDFVNMPSEAMEQGMDANVPDEIEDAKGEQVPNYGYEENLEIQVVKRFSTLWVNELLTRKTTKEENGVM